MSNDNEIALKSSKKKGVDTTGGGKAVLSCVDDLVLLQSESNCKHLHLHEKPQIMSGDQKLLLKGHSSQYVKLNVGGSLYYTTVGTLTKHNDTMLSAMFSGRMEVLTDSEGI